MRIGKSTNWGDRALYGTEETIHYHGEHVATRRRYNERLVMFLLRNRAPERFTEGRAKALNALDKATLRKLRKEWEADYKRQLAIEAGAREKRQSEDLFDKLQRMHKNWYVTMSPATRAAYRAFRVAEDADKANRFAWLDEDGAEPISVAEAEYEEFFNRARDKRPQIEKLIDMREWEKDEGEDEEKRGDD